MKTFLWRLKLVIKMSQFLLDAKQYIFIASHMGQFLLDTIFHVATTSQRPGSYLSNSCNVSEYDMR